MKLIRFALGATALAVASAASAVPTAGSYSFKSPTATTGRTTWLNTQAGYNASNGTDYGNSVTFASTGIAVPVVATAWASTGGVGGYAGTLESAYVSRYASGSTVNELAITSQPGTGNTTELTYTGSGSSKTAVPNTSGTTPEHAIDNRGSYEAMLFSFASAVQLNTVSVGFPSSGSSLDSDATVLVYTGAGNPTSGLSARTFSDLVAPGGGWAIAGNLSNLGTTGSGTLSSTVASSNYWMVGAYMAIGSNTQAMLNDGKDYFKVNGLGVTVGALTPRAVPEPGTMALSGIAVLAMIARRRRRSGAA